MSAWRCLALCLALWAAVAPAAARRPNIVLYLADDLGIGEVCADSPSCGIPPLPSDPSSLPGKPGDEWRVLRTPHMARLAARSTSFLRAYAPSSLCGPSRASILMGRPVGYTNVRSNKFNSKSQADVELSTDLFPFTHDLRTLGYATAMVGKWGLGTAEALPWLHGSFDAFYGLLTHVQNHVAYPTRLVLWDFGAVEKQVVDVELNKKNRNQLNLRTCSDPNTGDAICTHCNDLYRSKALEWLGAHSTPESRPLFLYWSATATHVGKFVAGGKSTAPSQRLGDRHDTFLANRNKRVTPAKFNVCAVGHAGSVEQHMDTDIGALLDYLEADPWSDANTLIIFTGDNGPALGECVPDRNFGPQIFRATSGLRGGKRSVFEGGLRVPMFLSWTGRVAPGRRSLYPVVGSDLATTILHAASQVSDVAHILPNGREDGIRFLNSRSMFAIASSNATDFDYQVAPRQYLQFEVCQFSIDKTCSTATLQVSKWDTKSMLKYIAMKNGVVRVFDVIKDPFEKKNLRKTTKPTTLQEFQRAREANRVPFPI